MTVKSHSHGKYAAHSHSGDGDHSDAELDDMTGGGDMAYAEPEENGDDEEQESKGKSLKASESGGSAGTGAGGTGVLSLAESRQLREEMAAMRFQLYERDVDAVVAKLTEKLPAGRGLSKVFADKLHKWLLSGGYQLSEGRRGEVLELLTLALSERATLDTRTFGASFDQEARRTIRQGGGHGNGGGAGGARVEDELRIVETAEQLALSDGKIERGQPLTALKLEDRERYMGLAAKEVGYN